MISDSRAFFMWSLVECFFAGIGSRRRKICFCMKKIIFLLLPILFSGCSIFYDSLYSPSPYYYPSLPPIPPPVFEAPVINPYSSSPATSSSSYSSSSYSSSSSSSDYSSSSSLRDCTYCRGTGKCPSGYSGSMSLFCGNSGNCSPCLGTGYIDGRQCTSCRGSGKCNWCYGTGSCPHCSGSGKVQ